jgi:hypothetical protein
MRRIVSKNHRTTTAQVTAEPNMHCLQNPVSTNVSEWASYLQHPVPKRLITESNAEMCKGWYHNNKTWTSDNWKLSRHMVWWIVLHAVPYINKSSRLENTQDSQNLECLIQKVKHGGRFCDCLGSNIVVHYSVHPFITLDGRITAREYVDRLGSQVHPMIQTFFPKKRCSFQRREWPHSQSWNCLFTFWTA